MNQYKEIEWTDDKVKKFWDYEAQFPENYFGNKFGQQIIERNKKYFTTCEHVLDYGAGPGFMLSYLLESDYKVSALEFSRKSAEITNKKFKDIPNFDTCYYIDELLATDKKFDLIFAVEVIEHLNDKYLNDLVDNLRLLLQPGGIGIFTTPNDEDLSKSMIYCPESNVVFHRWQHVRSWNQRSLTDFLVNNGFEIIRVYETDYNSYSAFEKLRRLVERKALQRKIKLPHLTAVFRSAQ